MVLANVLCCKAAKGGVGVWVFEIGSVGLPLCLIKKIREGGTSVHLCSTSIATALRTPDRRLCLGRARQYRKRHSGTPPFRSATATAVVETPGLLTRQRDRSGQRSGNGNFGTVVEGEPRFLFICVLFWFLVL